VEDAPHYKNDKKCKPCRRDLVTSHRNANIERIRAYDRERGNHQSAGYFAKYRRENPEKYKAHTAVNNAVRDGRLTKSEACDNCGDTGRIHGHHDNYDRPLVVDWLCVPCHHERHIVLNKKSREDGHPF